MLICDHLGIMNSTLKNFLETYLVSSGSDTRLGVSEEKLGSAIQDSLRIACVV